MVDMTELFLNSASQMTDKDYKKRFIAEYVQLTVRLTKLKNMVKLWDEGKLNFLPTCPRAMYDEQIGAMQKYQDVLVMRAKLENVSLPTI